MFKPKSKHFAVLAVLAASVWLSGCKIGSKEVMTGSLASPTLVSAPEPCDYSSARARALALLDKAASVRATNPQRAATYRRRASQVISHAEYCVQHNGRYPKQRVYRAIGRR